LCGKRLLSITPPWLELIPLTVVIFTLIYMISYYRALPDSVPRHFDARGMPNAWSDKAIIIVLPVLSLWIYFQSLLVNFFLIISPEDPAKVINLSVERKKKLGFERLERIRALTARFVWFTNTLTSILFAYIIRGTIKTALGYQTGLGWGVWFILGILIAAAAWMGIKISVLSRIPKEIDGQKS